MYIEGRVKHQKQGTGFGLTICIHFLGSLQHMTTHGHTTEIYYVIGQEARSLKSNFPGGSEGSGMSWFSPCSGYPQPHLTCFVCIDLASVFASSQTEMYSFNLSLLPTLPIFAKTPIIRLGPTSNQFKFIFC